MNESGRVLIPTEISLSKIVEKGSRLKPRFVDISAGSMHSMVVTFDGKLYAFGCGDSNQLGTGTEEEGIAVLVNGDELSGLHSFFEEKNLC